MTVSFRPTPQAHANIVQIVLFSFIDIFSQGIVDKGAIFISLRLYMEHASHISTVSINQSINQYKPLT